jgi:hypothetical protein
VSANIETEALAGDWVAISGGESLPEAPEDGTAYGRKDGAWTEVLEDVNDGNGTQWNGFEKSVDLGAALKIETVLGGKRVNIGNLHAQFGSGLNGTTGIPNGICIDNSGNIYVAGTQTTYKGISTSKICKIKPNGDPDDDFNTKLTWQGNALEVHKRLDGKYLCVIGYALEGASVVERGIIVLNQDGSRDNYAYHGVTYQNGYCTISVWPVSDGKIIAVGKMDKYSYSVDDVTIPTCILINDDGTLNTTFNNNVGAAVPTAATISRVFELADGRFCIYGDHASWDGDTDFGYITIIESDGTLDTSFQVGDKWENGKIWVGRQQTDGKLIFGGTFTSYNGNDYGRIIRFNLDGSVDTTFNTGTGFNNEILCLEILEDGRMLCGGNQSSYNGNATGTLTLISPTGEHYKDFRVFTGAAGPAGIFSLKVNPWGKIVIAGQFTSIRIRDDAGNLLQTITANRIASLMPNGLPDSADFDVERMDVFAEIVLHTGARMLEEPETYEDLDLVPLKKVEELIDDAAPATPTTKRVSVTATDGATPAINCDSGTEVYVKWEAGTASTAPSFSNVVVDSVIHLSMKKTISGDVVATFSQSGYVFALEGEATAASKAVTLTGDQNAFFSVILTVTAHEISGDKVVTIAAK